MDCTGCIHKKICELWVSAEGQDASCYDDTCKETVADILGDDYDLDRLRELVEADRDGRCVVLPSGGYTDKDGENALKSAMNTCFYHNNPVTRYIADAVAEKLTREAEEDALVKECANKAERTLGKQLREFYSEELIDAVLKGDK